MVGALVYARSQVRLEEIAILERRSAGCQYMDLLTCDVSRFTYVHLAKGQ